MMKQLELQNNIGISGEITITKTDSDGNVLSIQKEKNLVVSSSGHGRNLFIRQLVGDTTYGVAITNAKIGTGTTTPTDSDTDLETAVLSTIAIANRKNTTNTATLEWYITDAELPNGSYTEFGMFIGSQLFSRALFSTPYSKSTGENTRLDYTITLSAV